MKLLIVATALGVVFNASAQEIQISSKCETYLKEQVRLGAELLRVLALPSAPDFSDSEWKGYRTAVMLKMDAAYRKHKEERARKLKAQKEQRRLENERRYQEYS